MAGIRVHPLDLHHPTLYQKAGQSPSCFCGHQKALLSGNGPAPFSVPSFGLLASHSHPQLRSGYIQACGTHDEKALGLLAQGPEVDHQLEFVTGRDGPGYHSPGPALTTGRGGYFGGDPRPAPVRGEPQLIPWIGPHFSPPVLTGTRLGHMRGRGQGQGTVK